jgi:hypothetical protein
MKPLTSETRPEENKVNRINFWEARHAALSGKKVKRLDNDLVFDKTCFVEAGWTEEWLAADWEIVEEPKHITNFLNVYADGYWARHTSKLDADAYKDRYEDKRIACIAITVDEDGKLIEAKNV